MKVCLSPGRPQRRLLQRCWIEQTVPKDLAVILLLIIAEMVRLTDIYATTPLDFVSLLLHNQAAQEQNR